MEKENLNLFSKLSDKEAEVANMYWELGRAKLVICRRNWWLKMKKFLTGTVEKNHEEISSLNTWNTWLQKKLAQKLKSSEVTSTVPATLATSSSNASVDSTDKVKATEVNVSDLIKNSHQPVLYPPLHQCEHNPQCFARQPHLPPASFPLNLS